MNGKVQFSKTGETQFPKDSNDELIMRMKLFFKTIQIRKHDPSNFVMVISRRGLGNTVSEIALVDYRQLFSHEKGVNEDIFVLDVKRIPEFQDESFPYEVSVRFESLDANIKDINIEVYSGFVEKGESVVI